MKTKTEGQKVEKEAAVLIAWIALQKGAGTSAVPAPVSTERKRKNVRKESAMSCHKYCWETRKGTGQRKRRYV